MLEFQFKMEKKNQPTIFLPSSLNSMETVSTQMPFFVPPGCSSEGPNNFGGLCVVLLPAFREAATPQSTVQSARLLP